MKFANMILYYKPSCPREGDNLAELTKLTGKTQVPCLVVGGDPMLESDAIIAYLEGVMAG